MSDTDVEGQEIKAPDHPPIYSIPSNVTAYQCTFVSDSPITSYDRLNAIANIPTAAKLPRRKLPESPSFAIGLNDISRGNKKILDSKLKSMIKTTYSVGDTTNTELSTLDDLSEINSKLDPLAIMC